jgi:uncharacterized protein YndB with AHSA1/START domain
MTASEKRNDDAEGSGEGATVLCFERRLAHSPEKVWRALTEDAELRAWFPANVEGPRREGGELRFDDPEGRARPQPGKIAVFSPPRTLEYTWGNQTLRWDITPNEDGCVLVLTTTTPARRAPTGGGFLALAA